MASFKRSREYSIDLIANLSPEDCQAQSMEDASPAKWHLAHVTWFYELMLLKPFEKKFSYWNPHFAILFNSYYNGIGDKHPRKKRGLLTRPSMEEVLEWRENIDNRVTQLVMAEASPELLWLLQLGIQHEQQHQELLLTDINHLFSHNSLYPAYFLETTEASSTPETFHWIEGINGLVDIGYEGNEFYFDNEAPKHSALNQTHSIGSKLVSNADWLRFIEDGGYENFNWWLDEGWTWLKTKNISSPLYWILDHKDQPYRFSLYGRSLLDMHAPVSNISYFEADAFARWADRNISEYAGARLPTEFEWEAFARLKPKSSLDIFGKVWQWTSSNYIPYPGYTPWEGAAGEYNGKFMVNQMVLRGSSAYTPDGHSRVTYRNFFPAHTRWQMTGLRLARN
ncbi:ergothioneine biosynthesis protein EgtB [Burkholderiales bacterium]|nr:ergothioneine biosynthesis protein EgtB [Burkholderiales bacterium]